MKYQRQRERPAFEMSVEEFLAGRSKLRDLQIQHRADRVLGASNAIIREKTPSEIRREVLQAEKDSER